MSEKSPISFPRLAVFTEPGLRRSQRSRQSLPIAEAPPQRRKRVLSTSAIEKNAHVAATKKLKLDDKKAQTLAVNKKREARDDARKLWLYYHRDIVEPLLPPNSTFFIHLSQELERSAKVAISHSYKTTLDEQPALIKAGRMKDYQLEGLSFLVTMYRNGMNCILGDEMGLGKTLQALSLFAYIKENIPGPHDPHLIICPLSVLSSWEAEAARWVPSMRVVRFHGPENERNRLKSFLRTNTDFEVLITTYDTYSIEDQWFKSHRWSYCVLDEGHKIKNFETNLSHKLQGLGSLYRLRTPVQNDLTELWGLLHWLLPMVFTLASYTLFKDSFNITRGSYELSFLNALKKLISTIMLRRTKAVVAGDDVPPREETTVFIPLTEAQRFWTYRLLTKMDVPLEKIFTDTKDRDIDEGKREILAPIENNTATIHGSDWKRLMNLLMQLRKVCNHPYLLPNAEPEPYEIGEHVVTSSSKLMAIDKLLAEILPKGERVLIFSQWIGMLDVLEDFMTLRGIPYARLEGSTCRPRRALDIRLFQQEVSPYKVLLVSTKAGGLGINLTKATTVIMCDSDWNPQNDLQAIARAHRLGQTKVVKVYRLICQGSVEDQMLDRLRRKLFLSLKIMGSDSHKATDNTTLGAQELLNILRRGSSALAHSENGMNMARFSKATIADILEHSKMLESTRDVKIKRDPDEDDKEGIVDAEDEERKLLAGVAQVQSRLFEGKLVNKYQSNADISREWQALEKREHVDRTVSVAGMTYVVSRIPERILHPVKTPKKQKKFESDDWCIHCRDGGELMLCNRCPRVFHRTCRGLTLAEARRPLVSCSQHACCICSRSTSDAGGMLFRCRTCPQAFCDDCLPEGDLDVVGETLPEFQLLGYHQVTSAFYINCHDCVADFRAAPNSQFWVDWKKEITQAEQKLDSLP